MPTRTRQLVAVAALAVVVLYWIQLPGPPLSFGKVSTFPAGVVARVPPAPNVYVNAPRVRVLQLLSSMNTMWAGVFDAAGDRYAIPRIETGGVPRDNGCGAPPENWSGLYCTRTERIYIDMGDHLVVRAAGGDDLADDMLGYVLAHEVGHHVQNLRGGAPRSAEQALRRELHAECLAGVWGRADGRRAPPVWSYRSDAEHGTDVQQRFWLERGYARARPADCDGVWTATL